MSYFVKKVSVTRNTHSKWFFYFKIRHSLGINRLDATRLPSTKTQPDLLDSRFLASFRHNQVTYYVNSRLGNVRVEPHYESYFRLTSLCLQTLYRVPFSLLRDKNAQKYLFQLHPIAISPSLRVLQHCERRWRDLENFPLKPDGCILAVGNATYEPHRRLPGTGQELERLKESFPGRVKMLQEDEATRAKFLELVKQASRSKEQHVFACIHLGVHGLWSKPDPLDMDDEKNQYATGSLQFAKPSEHRTAQSYSPSIAGEVLRPRGNHRVEKNQFASSEPSTLS
jgi:hypothetical protein